MSLVQPARPPNANGNNVGVKRPYQLMINNAAHNSAADGGYPNKIKNIKLDKENLFEDLNEEYLVCIMLYIFFERYQGKWNWCCSKFYCLAIINL